MSNKKWWYIFKHLKGDKLFTSMFVKKAEVQKLSKNSSELFSHFFFRGDD